MKLSLIKRLIKKDFKNKLEKAWTKAQGKTSNIL